MAGWLQQGLEVGENLFSARVQAKTEKFPCFLLLLVGLLGVPCQIQSFTQSEALQESSLYLEAAFHLVWYKLVSLCPHSTHSTSMCKRSLKPKSVQSIYFLFSEGVGVVIRNWSNYILYAFQTQWLIPDSCNHWYLQFLRLSGVPQGKLSHIPLVHPGPMWTLRSGHPPLYEVTGQS